MRHLLLIGLVVVAGSLALSRPQEDEAKKAALKTLCLSNVKQLAVASLIYMSDFDDYMPRAKGWDKEIYPYTKNKAILTCPVLAEQKKVGGYSLNSAVAGKDSGKLKKPQETYMLFESAAEKFGASGSIKTILKKPRHYNMVNVAFMDGHAKAITPQP